jgi:MFS transporter, ACDE family, multidrug resistance protein
MLLFGAGYGFAQPLIDTQIIHVAPLESTGSVLATQGYEKYRTSLCPIILGCHILIFT